MVARLDFQVASPGDFEELRRRFTSLPMQPKVLQSRDGGTDISSPGRQSLSLLVGEETAGKLYATDVFLMPGFGAPSHHQPTEEELWYLLEGELDVRVGRRRTTIRAGSFAYIPRKTTHAFRNNGSAPARLLAWNSPAGHERAFEAMRAMAARGITAFPDLRDMFRTHEVVMHADENQSADNDERPGPKVVPNRAEALDISWPGVDARLLLGGAESAGDFDVADIRLEHAGAFPAHVHEQTDKCLYFLTGSADLTVASATQRVGRGAFAFIPRGTRMALSGCGGDPLGLLFWCTPGQPGERRLLQAPDCVIA